ncbi:MAG: aldo/keto reductase [Clostridia bacterium]|nr:aldo/keto reductase [Clostridia bacterium]
MEYVALGRDGIKVSRLCIGSLTVGPLQANLELEKGAGVLAYAFERGINFTDTAQYYRNYAYIKRAMQISGKYDTVISTKTYAYDRKGAKEAFEQARRELDRDYIDIFMLHEQESIHTLRGHMEAAEFLFEMREKGYIRSVGVSMHHIAAVEGVCELSKIYPFSVIHPIFNKAGLGIADGDISKMTEAIKKAKSTGIGIFSMKPLGGGNLIKSASEALDFVLDAKYDDLSPLCDSVAVGMQLEKEVDANISYFENRTFGNVSDELKKKHRRLHIEEYCEGCGNCVKRCKQGALTVSDGKAVLCDSKCILCGYCSAVCPLFAIKVL